MKHSKRDTGRRIKLLRRIHSIRQEDLAGDLSATTNQIKQWEIGRASPPPDYVGLMMERFGVTSDWIYYGKVDGLSAAVLREIRNAQEDDLDAA